MMAFLLDTMWKVGAWLQGEPLILAAVAMTLLGPGIAVCWIGTQVNAVRVPRMATWPAQFRARPRAAGDRIEQRLSSLCTALSMLTDSTEAGLRETLQALERLSRGAAGPEVRAVTQQRVRHAAGQGRTARDIAIAEGISEGEVRLRLRLESIETDVAESSLGAPQPALCDS